MKLNSSRAKIYNEIWAMPYSKQLRFQDVSNLLVALGCNRHSRGGANVVFEIQRQSLGNAPTAPSAIYQASIHQRPQKVLNR